MRKWERKIAKKRKMSLQPGIYHFPYINCSAFAGNKLSSAALSAVRITEINCACAYKYIQVLDTDERKRRKTITMD